MSCRVCKYSSGKNTLVITGSIWGFETGFLWGEYCEYTQLPEVNVLEIPNWSII